MKKYLVGGAVRNILLKIPIKERDWVVIGSNPKEMLKIGYEQVGKDFPVFLHPETHEEYALARTERKSGIGYAGFTCHTNSTITIEEDLYRRDLTINAMAYDIHTHILIDPYQGQKDIKLRLLRHVSHTFTEDPLRILRVARFSAQFAHMHFTIAPETLILMKKMIYELPSISPERIWIETKKALNTNSPYVYFQVLRNCGALKILFPELDILFNIPLILPSQKYAKHSIDAGSYTMQTLKKVTYVTNDLSVRFAVLCHSIGIKNIATNKQLHTSNYGILGIPSINILCNRLKIPRNIHYLSNTIARYYEDLRNVFTIPIDTIVTLFDIFNCWHNPKKIEQMISVNKSNIFENINNLHLQEKFLRQALHITQQVKTSDIISDGFIGSNIKKELHHRRIFSLQSWIKNHPH